MTVTLSTEQMQGRVLQVNIDHAGDQLAADAAIGASVLSLYDVADFSETGGQLQVNGLTYSYLSIDDVAATITLATTLTVAVLTDDQVYSFPLAEEKWAMVQLDNEDDVILARIPHNLYDRFADGIRTEDDQESALITLEGGVWTVGDIIAKVPEIEASYVGTDGLAPTASPTPIAYGTPLSILLRWVPLSNADSVTYDVHMSTINGFTEDLVGNTTRIVQDEVGSSATIRKLPSGLDLIYGFVYYFKLVTKDADGLAPASPQVSGQMQQITNADISAAYAYLGQVVVDQLVGGTLSADVVLASMFSNRGGGAGAGVDWDPSGISLFDSAGVPATVLQPGSSKFLGEGEFGSLTSTGPAAFRDLVEIAKGAEVYLRSNTTAPVSPPSAVINWPGSFTQDLFSGNYGLVWTGTDWATVGDSVNPLIQRSTAADVALGNTPSGKPRPWGGVTKIGTDWFVLGWRQIPSGLSHEWIITKYDSTGVFVAEFTYIPVTATEFDDISAGIGVAAIGTDGTNVLIAEFDDANNRFRIQVRSPTTLAVSSTINTGANAGFTGTVMGIIGGNFDFGSFRYCILSRNGHHVWPFTSAGVYNATEAFPVPAPAQCSGLTWDGTRFWTTNAKTAATGLAQVYKHSTYAWNTSGDLLPHKATCIWRDTDATGGTHETTMGGITTFLMKKRAGVTLTSAAIPDLGGTDDPNAVAFFLNVVDSARTNFWRQTLPADGVNTITVSDGIVLSGTNPPATNDFPSATPGLVRNDLGTVIVSGNGSVDANDYLYQHTPFYPPILVSKAANQGILNSIAVQQDTHLRFNAVANAKYLVTIMALASVSGSATTADIQLGMSLPAGASWSGGGPNPNVAVGAGPIGSGDWSALLGSAAAMLPYGMDATPGASTILFLFAEVTTVGTAGTAIFTWRMSTLQNVTLTIATRSVLKAERIS